MAETEQSTEPQRDEPESLPSSASPLELACYVFGIMLIPLIPILMIVTLTPDRGM